MASQVEQNPFDGQEFEEERIPVVDPTTNEERKEKIFLGKGGFGEVVKGNLVDEGGVKGAEVAIKLLTKHDDGAFADFAREYLELKRLKGCENIVEVFSCKNSQTIDGKRVVAYAMELAKFSLQNMIERFYQNGLPPDILIKVICDMGNGLRHLRMLYLNGNQETMTTHEDLKCENMLVFHDKKKNGQYVFKLSDLGSLRKDFNSTVTATVIGNPRTFTHMHPDIEKNALRPRPAQALPAVARPAAEAPEAVGADGAVNPDAAPAPPMQPDQRNYLKLRPFALESWSAACVIYTCATGKLLVSLLDGATESTRQAYLDQAKKIADSEDLIAIEEKEENGENKMIGIKEINRDDCPRWLVRTLSSVIKHMLWAAKNEEEVRIDGTPRAYTYFDKLVDRLRPDPSSKTQPMPKEFYLPHLAKIGTYFDTSDCCAPNVNPQPFPTVEDELISLGYNRAEHNDWLVFYNFEAETNHPFMRRYAFDDETKPVREIEPFSVESLKAMGDVVLFSKTRDFLYQLPTSLDLDSLRVDVSTMDKEGMLVVAERLRQLSNELCELNLNALKIFFKFWWMRKEEMEFVEKKLIEILDMNKDDIEGDEGALPKLEIERKTAMQNELEFPKSRQAVVDTLHQDLEKIQRFKDRLTRHVDRIAGTPFRKAGDYQKYKDAKKAQIACDTSDGVNMTMVRDSKITNIEVINSLCHAISTPHPAGHPTFVSTAYVAAVNVRPDFQEQENMPNLLNELPERLRERIVKIQNDLVSDKVQLDENLSVLEDGWPMLRDLLVHGSELRNEMKELLVEIRQHVNEADNTLITTQRIFEANPELLMDPAISEMLAKMAELMPTSDASVIKGPSGQSDN